MKMTVSICIDAAQEKVWAALADIEQVHIWADPVVSAHCPQNKSRGEGASLSGQAVAPAGWSCALPGFYL